MTRFAIALGLTCLALTGPSPARAQEGPSELLGGYTVVAGEKFGETEPEDRIKGTTVRITKDSLVVTTADKKEAYASTYKLDMNKTPWGITMTSKLAPSEGQVARGLIEKKGDTVRLIYALPDGETPTEFKTKAKQLMFVMKNMNR